MNSIEKRRQNDIAGLIFVYSFGWLRAAELGGLLFPKNATAAEAANRIIRGWKKRNLVIVRELPDRAGKAVVLAAAGVRFLSENGHTASRGKDLGSTTAGVWKPPASWKHDLIATGLLVELRKRGYRVIPETALRRRQSESPKLPDGLAKAPEDDAWIWIEVEHARKTGKSLRELGQALALAATGEIKAIAGTRCTLAMVAYCYSTDERGYAINHRDRVLKSISEHTREPIDVLLAHCTLVGAGLGGLELEKTRVEPQKVFAVRRVLEANGWKENGEGAIQSSYGRHSVTIWEERGRWIYKLNDSYDTICSTISEAKELAAQEISERL